MTGRPAGDRVGMARLRGDERRRQRRVHQISIWFSGGRMIGASSESA
jgi:hypothetical protein